MSTTISKKHFKWMRALAIVAIVCTFSLFTFIMVESSLDTQTSAALTQQFYDLFRPTYDNIEKEPDVIKARSMSLKILDYASGEPLYVGQSWQLSVTFGPTGAEPEPYHFVIEEENSTPTISIDENNVLTIIGYADEEAAKVYAVLDSDESVRTTSINLYAHSPSPIDKNTIQSIDLRKSKATETIGTAENPLIAGGRAYFYINDGDVRSSFFFYESSDESVVKVTSSGSVFAIGPGTATIRMWSDYKDISWEYTYDVHVDPAPTTPDDPSVPDDPNEPVYIIPEEIFVPETIYIALGETYSYSVLNVSYFPQNASKGIEVTAEDNEFARHLPSGIVPQSAGTYTITVHSIYDPSVSKEVTVVISRPDATYIDILTDSSVSIYDGIRLNSFVGPKYAEGTVIWSVVNGNGTIDENGKLQPKRIGTVVVRATLAENPAIYTEKELTVQIFDDFASFVRKIMGHCLLFAVLGFGYTACFYFLSKRKYLAPAYATVASIASAGFSEFLQMFAEGRSFLAIDVMVDSIGSVLGIGIGMAIIGIVCGVWRAISGKSFHKIALAYRSLNFTNMFKSNETINMLFSADVYNRDPNQHKIDTSSDNPQEQSELPADD